MMYAAALAVAHARHHALRSGLLALCVCVAILLPASAHLLVSRFQANLLERGRSTPMIVGAKGNRFDLTLASLYFRKIEIPTVTTGDLESVAATNLGVVIPLNTRFTARLRPLVATSPEYFEFRGLRVVSGELPLMIGEVVLGARVAREFGLGTGDAVFSDQRALYDLTKPAAVKLRITGVLAPSGTADDQALFADIKTAWLLEGLAHGHAEASQVPAALILEKGGTVEKSGEAAGSSGGGNTIISEEMVDFNEVTPGNARAFHVHADPKSLPLTSLIVVPSSEKDRSILAARLNAGKALQAVAPLDVVNELLLQVLRVRRLVDGISLVVGGLTGVLLGLVGVLSLRLRAREIETLHRVGVGRAQVAVIIGGETALVVAAGVMLAAVGVFGIYLFDADVLKFL